MSYFPPPYSPPTYDYDPAPMLHPDLLRPARQASVLFFILAAIFFAGGAMFLMTASIPIDQWPMDKRDQILEVANRAGVTVRALILTPAITFLVVSLILVVLGLLVRRGGRAAVIFGIVIDGLLLLALTGMTISSFRDPGSAIPGVIIAGGIGAVMIMLMRRLIAAERAARIAAAQAAYFYAQQWQAAQMPLDPASGYGYLNNPPPPPPPNQNQ